ncbi:hypothetical protein [Paraclostridium bifermentans]|uniref:hypothetical protein n=1 Tax=Paraclostridium bifermentans TaxID=1490 RepID=UPI00189A82EA|nr:hypothetical protein [Paraclostridium bifermentans]
MNNMNRKVNYKNRNKEGCLQESATGARYIFYKQLGGNMIRLDVFDSKKISDVEEFRNYDIVESSEEYSPDSETTKYYLLPKKKEQKYYTDSTGTTYKTSSMYVYSDMEGNYRSFADDTKRHIETTQMSLESSKKLLNRALNSPFGDNTKDIELYKGWVASSEKRLVNLNKELSRGGI